MAIQVGETRTVNVRSGTHLFDVPPDVLPPDTRFVTIIVDRNTSQRNDNNLFKADFSLRLERSKDGVEWDFAGGGAWSPGVKVSAEGDEFQQSSLSVSIKEDGWFYRIGYTSAANQKIAFTVVIETYDNGRPVNITGNSVGLVAEDSTTGTGGVTSLETASLTTSGTNTCGVISTGSFVGGNTVPTAVKWGGSSGTDMGTVDADATNRSGQVRSGLYTLVNCGTGTAYLEYSGGGQDSAHVAGFLLNNVDQTTPVRAASIWQLELDGSGVGETTMSTASGEMIITGGHSRSSYTSSTHLLVTQSETQTLDVLNLTRYASAAAYLQATGSTETVGYQRATSYNEAAVVGLSIQESGGAPAANPKGPFGLPFHGPFAGPIG